LLKLCCEVAKYRPLLLKLYKQRSVSNYLLKTWPNITCDEALFLLYEFTFGRLGMKRDGNDHQVKSECYFRNLLSEEVRDSF